MRDKFVMIEQMRRISMRGKRCGCTEIPRESLRSYVAARFFAVDELRRQMTLRFVFIIRLYRGDENTADGRFAFRGKRRIDRAQTRGPPHACRDRRNFVNYAKSRHVWGTWDRSKELQTSDNRNVATKQFQMYEVSCISEFRPAFCGSPRVMRYSAWLFPLFTRILLSVSVVCSCGRTRARSCFLFIGV